ncbi:MAG: helix-turn-helix domain-containing protein [Firmicutes bacterium]|nr:helix-turn-helix domain-containing protein [Bacillota bacterium]
MKKIDIDIKKTVGQRLKESRVVSNKTQVEVARLMLMTQQQYSRFENGIFELNYSQIIFLCKLYDISADYLLGIADY